MSDYWSKLQPADFLATLQRGDLVLASNHGSEKLHLVHLKYAKPLDEGGVNPGLWSARALCSIDPRYYYRPRIEEGNTEESHKCRRCFQRWRAMGRPDVKGMGLGEKTVATPDNLWLPFAWEEVTPVGHPLDIPEDRPLPEGAEAEEGGAIDYTRPEHRTEVRRWVRGTRYVRIVKLHDEDRYGVFYGDVDEPKTDRWTYKHHLEGCLKKAVEVMALGGTP